MTQNFEQLSLLQALVEDEPMTSRELEQEFIDFMERTEVGNGGSSPVATFLQGLDTAASE